jgi:methionyl-tRNA formyltransferase
MLRLVFFGTPDFAVPSLDTLLATRHPVVAVVTQPDRPRGRGHRLAAPPVKEMALARGVPVWQPERLKDERLLDELRGLAPDLGVVAAYGRILPEVLLALPHLGMINVHASLLPAWRGAAPVHRAVMAGETETGVTIMRVVRDLDAGPTLAQAVRPIGPEETSAEVERDLARLGASLLPPALAALESGTAVETPQDHTRATYAPRLAKEESPIDWSAAAAVIHDRVRGLHPWPLASCWIDDARVLVLRTRPAGRPTGTGDTPPGSVLDAHGRLLIACGEDTALDILELQPEGRRPMAAREFLAGRRLRPGARLAASPP